MDPLAQPIGTNDITYGFKFLDAVQAITTRFKGIHTMWVYPIYHLVFLKENLLIKYLQL